jgi:hypothetical protein
VLIRDAVSHYAPVLIAQNSPRRRPWRARIFSIGEGCRVGRAVSLQGFYPGRRRWLVLFVPVVRPTERNARWLIREQPVLHVGDLELSGEEARAYWLRLFDTKQGLRPNPASFSQRVAQMSSARVDATLVAFMARGVPAEAQERERSCGRRAPRTASIYDALLRTFQCVWISLAILAGFSCGTRARPRGNRARARCSNRTATGMRGLSRAVSSPRRRGRVAAGAGNARGRRKMHYGEIEHRSVYGEATSDQAKELHEEGLEFHPLPVLPDEWN